MSGSNFRHVGRVVGIESGGVVVVKLDKLAACEGCKARGKCGNNLGVEGESASSIMRVVNSESQNFEIGESVTVSITYRVGMIAVMYTYVIPLILFLGAIVILLTFGTNEGLAACLSFVIVALYYVGVYLMRERFERVVDFKIEKT